MICQNDRMLTLYMHYSLNFEGTVTEILFVIISKTKESLITASTKNIPFYNLTYLLQKHFCIFEWSHVDPKLGNILQLKRFLNIIRQKVIII